MPRRLDDLPGRNPAVISKNIEFGNSSNSYNVGIGIHLAKPGIDTIIDADICSECHGVRTDTSRARGTSREGVSRGSARTYITFNAFYTTGPMPCIRSGIMRVIYPCGDPEGGNVAPGAI
jgi:hypothetical protein